MDLSKQIYTAIQENRKLHLYVHRSSNPAMKDCYNMAKQMLDNMGYDRLRVPIAENEQRTGFVDDDNNGFICKLIDSREFVIEPTTFK